MEKTAAKTILAVAVGPQKDLLIDAKFVAEGRLGQVRPYIQGLIEELARRNHQLGTDFVVAYKEREPDDLDKVVADAVKLPEVSLIFAMSTTALRAALRATTSKPIVFPSISNPAADGVVPGGNATGVSARRTQTAKDCLDRFKATVRLLKKVYALHQSGYGPATRALESLQSADPEGIVQPLPVESRQFIQEKLANIPLLGPGEVGVLVLPSDLMLSAQRTIIETAHKRGIPTFFPITDCVKKEDGALAGYGVPQRVCGELAADYVHKILWEGIQPKDLPVKTGDRFEWLVSGKVANDLKINIKGLSAEAQVI